MLQVGELIAGKFRVDRLIGRGGMGIVAAATHVELDQRVAVKVLDDELARDPQNVERLLREARACANLRSEHSCRVIDVGRLDSGAPYIVMELLEGADLASVGRLPLATAAGYVVQACVALAEAHGRGIVHRDLKPGNLFVTKRLDGSPLVKVLDFGIAKAPPRRTDVALTRTASLLGSPRYMAPEQLRSARDVDARTDIWGLGVILYELVSGRAPFPAETLTELAVQIAVDPPLPLDVDPGFAAIVARCLAKAPADRYADVGQLATALATFAGPDHAKTATLAAKLLLTVPDATLPSPVAAGTPTVSTLAGASTALPAAPPRKSARLALVIGGVLAIAGGAFVVQRTRGAAGASIDAAPAPTADATPVDAAPADAMMPVDAAPADAMMPVDAAHDARIDAAVGSLDAATPNDAPVHASWKSAIEAAEARDCKRAIRLGEAANAAHPDPTQAVRMKPCLTQILAAGWAAQEAGEPVAMQRLAELAVAIDDSDDAGHRELTEAACKLKNPGLAQRHFDRLMQSSKSPVAEVCAASGIELH